MKILPTEHKLSRDYFLFTFVAIIIVIIISGWRTWSNYQTLQKDREFRYGQEGDRIVGSLEETFGYIENFMHFFGEKISNKGVNDAQTAADVLLSYKINIDRNGQDIFTWTFFDFIDPEGFMIASSAHGVIKNPKQIPKDKRSWMTDAPKKPWKVHLSKVDIGMLSGEKIIPVGFGVTDKQNNFLGIISMGINTGKLARKLEKSLSQQGTSFIILDKDFEVQIASLNNKKYIDKKSLKEKLNYIKYESKDADLLREPIKIGNIRYSFYRLNYKYPFTILIGDEQHVLDKEFRETVALRVESSIYMGFIFIVLLLYFFKRKIITPVTDLFNAAIKLSKGDTDVVMPKTNIYEYNALAEQLGKVAIFIKELNQMQKELENALNIKSAFLSNMSHELRTPLNAVIGFSEVMQQKLFGDLNDKYSEYVDDIHAQGKYLLALIEQVLDASKYEAGMMKAYIKKENTAKIINSAIKSVTSNAAKRNITIEKQLDKSFADIYCDKIKIIQACVNILSNSIKYSKDGSNVYIRAFAKNDEFVIEVQDYGAGIAQDDIKNIMTRFGQAKNVHKAEGGGTGLGVAITVDILKLHGGRVEIDSKEDVGTTVKLIFPPHDGQENSL
ncbi:ATP-binding protein [Rickettsiales bacterium]|nr:ATP-binding protein [Rickettsiales bacterium]